MSALTDEYEAEQYKELEMLDEKGNVFLVKDMRSNAVWVKKIISPKFAEPYKNIKGINNKNIAYIKDVLIFENKCCIIQEYAAGIDLQQFVEGNGAVKPKEAYKIIYQICDALEFLHGRNIIHRDIKPANIILLENNTIKLIDLGISRIKKEDIKKDTTIMGTVGYAAPEQFGFEQTDVTADIYSIGVVLNFILTGKLPSECKYIGKFTQVIDKCMEMNPKHRYKNIIQLKKALNAASKRLLWMYKYTETLPGFRTGNKLKKFIAKIIYIFIGFFIAVGILSIFAGSYSNAVMYFFVGIFVIFIPFLIAADYLYYQEKIPIIKMLPKETRITIFVFVAYFISTVFCKFVSFLNN